MKENKRKDINELNNQIVYDQANIDEVRKHIQEGRFGPEDGKVWGMVERTSGECKVTITEESRNICVRSLTKLK